MNVLIVDDEQIIRKGIRTFVPWDELGCHVAGEASNGSEALEIMEKTQIHIVISDIRMPLMDGLELSREIRTRHPHCKVILLTGYEDFEYAKKALKYKVTDYLLKPVGDDELTQVLRTTAGVLRREGEERSINLQRESLIQKNRENIRARYIENLVRGTVEEDFDPRQLADLDLDVRKDGLFQVIILADGPDLSEQDVPPGSFSIPFEYETRNFRLVLHCPDSGDETFFSRLNRENRAAAVGSRVKGMENIPRSFREALDACGALRFLRSPALIYHSGRDLFRDKLINSLPPAITFDEAEKKILADFRSLSPRTEDFAASLGRFFLQESLSREDYIRSCRRLCNLAAKEASARGIKLNRGPEDPLGGVDSSERWTAIIEKADGAFSDLEKLVLDRAGSRYSVLTSQTISHIEKHFKEDLSLGRIAESLGVTESHLSRIFKRDTGMNFVPWVNRYRVEYSLDLLASGDLKVYDIADLSGFSDYKYYARQFKKFTGISPTEYQKNLFSLRK